MDKIPAALVFVAVLCGGCYWFARSGSIWGFIGLLILALIAGLAINDG